MTFATLRDLVRSLTGDDGTFWPEASLLSWANEAVALAVRRSGCLEQRETILAVANQAEYDVPADCDRVFRIAFDGEALLPVSQHVLRSSNSDFASITGTPFMYYLDELNEKFGLYYKPSTATTVAAGFAGEWGGVIAPLVGTTSSEWGGIIDPLDAGGAYSGEWGDIVSAVSADDIEVFYRALPKAMDSGDDEPSLPPWSHGCVLFWVLSRAFEADTMLQDLGRAAFWRKLSETVFERLTIRTNNKLPKVWQFKSSADGPVGPRIRDRYPDTIGAGEDTHA